MGTDRGPALDEDSDSGETMQQQLAPYVVMCSEGRVLTGEPKVDPETGEAALDSAGNYIDATTRLPVTCR